MGQRSLDLLEPLWLKCLVSRCFFVFNRHALLCTATWGRKRGFLQRLQGPRCDILSSTRQKTASDQLPWIRLGKKKVLQSSPSQLVAFFSFLSQKGLVQVPRLASPWINHEQKVFTLKWNTRPRYKLVSHPADRQIEYFMIKRAIILHRSRPGLRMEEGEEGAFR